jgi:hypothetical protein
VYGTVRDVQNFIMLGVEPTQSADEARAFGEGLRYHFHVFPTPQQRLSPKEPPPLASGPTPALSPLGSGTRRFAERGDLPSMKLGKCPQAEGADERERPVD